MKNYITSLFLILTVFSSYAKNEAEVDNAAAKKYDCIEVNMLTSKKKNTKSRALKRAARIPKDVVKNIQNFMVDEIDLDENGLNALAPEDATCENPDTALVLNGVVVDYKKGNRLVRYIVSFGAGKQKIEANLVLTEKASGKEIARGRVVDRKIAGFAGGSENKGKRDFAEKVNNFVRTAINLKKTLKR